MTRLVRLGASSVGIVTFLLAGAAQPAAADVRTSVSLNSNHDELRTKPGDIITLSGRMSPAPVDPARPWPLQITVTHPDGAYAFDGTLFTDPAGLYQLPVTVTQHGYMHVHVSFSGDATYRPSSSRMVVSIPRPIGMVIVMTVDESTHPWFEATEYLADVAVSTFRRRSIPDGGAEPRFNRVWYMHPDPSRDISGDGVPDTDDAPTLANLERAVTVWAVGQVATRDAHGALSPTAVFDTPLTLYLVGDVSAFVAPLTLDSYLDSFEQLVKEQFTSTGVTPPSHVPINVIIDAPNSGDFLQPLAGAGRYLLTSTDRYDPATGTGGANYYASSGSVSFSSYFFSRIAVGHGIQPSFAYAQVNILTNEQTGNQHPQLEANGNGRPNELADELTTASEPLDYRHLRSVGGQTVATDAPPRFKNALGQVTLRDVSTALLWVYLDDPLPSEDPLVLVNVTIVPPPASFEEAHVIALSRDPSGQWTGVYDRFFGEGEYRLIYGAVDAAGNGAVPIVKSVVVLDESPPHDVAGVAGVRTASDSAMIRWNTSESPDTQGYRLYATYPGEQEHLVGDVGNVHQVTITGVTFNTAPGLYAFRVTAYDRTPLESPGSTTTLDARLDTTAPAIYCAATDGVWHSSNASIACTATDAGSGLVDAALSSFMLWTAVPDGVEDGSASTGTQQVCDHAGNCAIAGPIAGNKVDRKAPALVTSAWANGLSYTSGTMTNRDVRVEFTCADHGSGVAAVSAPQLLSAEGLNQLAAGSCSDHAGNTIATSFGPINIDKTPPVLSPVVSPNPVTLNASALASANATDALSGVASAGCAAPHTTSVGSHSLSCTAIDRAGNAATATAPYQVEYASSGVCVDAPGHQILQPINASGESVFKANATVPFKFRVCDGSGLSIGSPGTVTRLELLSVTNGTLADEANEASPSGIPDIVFRWDAVAQQWLFNHSTKGQAPNQTYRYRIGLNDGSTIEFQYGLR